MWGSSLWGFGCETGRADPTYLLEAITSPEEFR